MNNLKIWIKNKTYFLSLLKFLCLTCVLFCYACKSQSNKKSPQEKKVIKESLLKPDDTYSNKPTDKTDSEAQVSPVAPLALVKLEQSAYGNNLYVEENNVYLLTKNSFYRFTPKKKPEIINLDFGYGSALNEKQVIYWSEGTLYSLSKDNNPKPLLKIKNQPQQIMVSNDNIVWLERDKKNNYSFWRKKGGKAQLVYKAKGDISSPLINNDLIYSVEKDSDTTWKLLAVSISGKTPAFLKKFTGRTPSGIYFNQYLYYYDLPSRSIFKVNPDLSEQKTIATKVVCSPLAISDRVLCARVEGLFEVSLKDETQKILTYEPIGLVTQIAASNNLVAWISDSGKSQLTLYAMPLFTIDHND